MSLGNPRALFLWTRASERASEREREREDKTARVMGKEAMEDGDTSCTPRPAEMSCNPGVQNSMPRSNTKQLGRKGAASASAPAATAEGFISSPRENLLFFSPPPSPLQHRSLLAPAPPVSIPASRSAAETSPAGAVAPLTIFYNGTVATFNLPRDKAEAIINWAERTTPGFRRTERPTASFGGGSGRQPQLPPQAFSLENLGEDLPLARKRSLQRFLAKRRER